MTVYEDGDYRLELDRKGKVYHKEQLYFIGDTHLAISMFVKHSTNMKINTKLKRRIKENDMRRL